MHLSCGINEAASKPQGTYTITVNRELGVVNETEKHAAVFGCKARRQQHRQTMSLNSQGIQLDGQQQSVGNSVDYEQLQNALFVVRELMLQRVVVFLSYKYTNDTNFQKKSTRSRQQAGWRMHMHVYPYL